jgi:hypothetical protein
LVPTRPANTFTRDAARHEPRPRGSLSAASVAREPIAWREEGGAVAVDCALQPHAVAAIRLELA